MGIEQVQEIIGLQQTVREFREADPMVPVLQALPHGFPSHHHIDREMLADIAQEIHHRNPAEPIGVIHQGGRV